MAYQFIQYTLEPTNNAGLSKYMDYGPTVTAALANVPEEKLKNLPTAPQNMTNYVVQSAEFWGIYGPELNARFATWVSR
ncbi:hypothetical protein D3C84_1089390 [compost metagenome]